MGEALIRVLESATELEDPAEASGSISRRRLIFRDSLVFLSLTIVTIALFALTLFLFRSFAAHRTELGKRWSDRGRAALQRNQPEQAIDALRTALSYAPGERSYELLLAQALAMGGHTEEAYNYFSGLWDAEPGSGFINLQLARLAAEKKDEWTAVNFYRASIYGTWEGDGAVRRRTVRLELIRYLLKSRDAAAARAELLVAQGNADDDPAFASQVGSLFEQAGDRTNALDAYKKAAEADPKNPVPLAAAGSLAYSMGEFATARDLLRKALHAEGVEEGHEVQDRAGLTDLLQKSDRILELMPSRKLSSEQRVTRLLALRNLAKKRLGVCSAMPQGLPPQLQEINVSWTAALKADTRAALLRDSSRQDQLLQRIFATESQADGLCGPATGDDALVVLLAHDPKAVDR